MEDVSCVQFERVNSGGVVVEYAAFAIFDGHGGKNAAHFARDHLLENIKTQKGFFSNDSEVVKKAISDAFVATHYAMWNELPTWPKTAHGHPSTAGTTASLVIIRGNRMYVANVGDSMIVMGSRDHNENDPYRSYVASDLTIDHKPELIQEKRRIERCGGCVMNKSGVNRVVWSRPQVNHTGPIRRSTKIDKIPFLAVARSLGDLWSYNSELDEFVVSPVPDVYAYDLNKNKDQFLILASDGLWNMVRPQLSVSIVGDMENKRRKKDNKGPHGSPAHELVRVALESWKCRMMRADNTSVIVVVIERRKIDVAKNRDSYVESWTSATAAGKPHSIIREGHKPCRSAKKDGSTTDPETATSSSAEASASGEPLQDNSISSSCGDTPAATPSISTPSIKTEEKDETTSPSASESEEEEEAPSSSGISESSSASSGKKALQRSKSVTPVKSAASAAAVPVKQVKSASKRKSCDNVIGSKLPRVSMSTRSQNRRTRSSGPADMPRTSSAKRKSRTPRKLT